MRHLTAFTVDSYNAGCKKEAGVFYCWFLDIMRNGWVCFHRRRYSYR